MMMATHATAALKRFGLVLMLALFAAVPAKAQDGGPDAFAIDALNSGLGEPPKGIDRTTPQSSLEAFLSAAERTDYATAAHLLDLSDIEDSAQAQQGAQIARQLFVVLDRKIPLDFAAIPDRPDGMVTSGSNRDPMVGEPRKSFNLGMLDLARWPVSVRLNRVVPEGGDPVWVFSRQTVEHASALYERYGPTSLEQALPQPLRGEAFWGLLWWEVIAIPLILIATVALGMVLFKLFGIVMRKVPSEVVERGVKKMRAPTVLLVLAAFVHTIVSELFVFSAGADAAISTLFWALMLVAVVLAASRILDMIIDEASDRYLDTIDDPENTSARHWFTNLSAAKRIGIMAVVVLGVAWALNSLNIFSSFGLSLAVSAGVATAVFGLAAQAILGNILASLQLALAQPIRIGDAIYYDDHWAYVEQINYTYVQLRTWDQKRYIVPVKNFVSNSFENWTKSDPEMIMPVALTLDHKADVELLRREFKRIAENDPDWAEDAEPKVQVIGQSEDGILVRFYCTADNPTAAWNLHCRVRERMLSFLRQLDEPSDLPLTRIAYVANTTATNAAAPRTDKDGVVEETGEPKQDVLHKEAAE